MKQIRVWVSTHLHGKTAVKLLSWVKKQMNWKNLIIQLADIIFVVLIFLIRWIGFAPAIIFGISYFLIYIVISMRSKLKEAIGTESKKEGQPNGKRKKK